MRIVYSLGVSVERGGGEEEGMASEQERTDAS